MPIDRYAVIGNPVAHSRSPEIHHLFAQQTNQKIQYDRILAEHATFKQVVHDFFARGGRGLNITLPFKNDAYAITQIHTEQAEIARAVNTVSMATSGQYMGANTDGIGLINDLKKNVGITIKDKSILILGAGGAVQGIVQPLLKESPQLIIIANRAVERAHNLQNQFRIYGPIRGVGFTNIPQQKFNLIINATATSLYQQALPLSANLIDENCCCYDLVYSDEPTPFMRWASNSGAYQVHDGLGMLIEQAAESFYIWRNVRPETSLVYKALRPV